MASQSGDLRNELVTVTRLVGADPALVLHGGGNTSLKTSGHDVTGAPLPVLWMKASGCDMSQATPASFTPLRLDRLRDLLPPTRLTDDQLASELRLAQLHALDPVASVETLVHAALPHPAVVHSHADAILALTNTPTGPARIATILGPHFVVVDYAMPGVDLGAAVAQAWATQGGPAITGLVVPGHGLFTMGSTPREAYDLHLQAISRAQAHLPTLPGSATTGAAANLHEAANQHESANLHDVANQHESANLHDVAHLRRQLADAAGRPLLLRREVSAASAAFVRSPTLTAAAARGPITPDHATRTKPFPLIGRDVPAYERKYREYVAAGAQRRQRELRELDPAPRVVLDEELGLLVAGPDAPSLVVNADIARHTLTVIAQAEQLGGYQPVGPEHVFDLEYWSLQQDKVATATLPLSGQVALVTGAASGIGKACAAALLAAGCAVVGWDIDAQVATAFDSPAWLGLPVDVCDRAAQEAGLRACVQAFGGVDILVVAAGIFPSSAPLGDLEMEAWQRTMAVNVESVITLYGLVWPLLALAPGGGRVVVVASKNVPAPGQGAVAYSASKAALTQASRVAALEWADKGIRVNMLHPDAVFDTGLWTPELIASRAAHYGLSVADYKRRNLLHTEVTSATCGALALAMVTEPFRCTTGAQVPIDGGSDRVI